MKLITKLIIVLLPLILIAVIFGFATYGNGYYFDFYSNFHLLIDKLNFNYTSIINDISNDWNRFTEQIQSYRDITNELSSINVTDLGSFFNAIGLFFRSFAQLFVLIFSFMYFGLLSVVRFGALLIKNSVDLFSFIVNPIFLKK